jgi:Ca2+/Na+ antiporter
MNNNDVIAQLKKSRDGLASRRSIVQRVYYGLLILTVGLLILGPLGAAEKDYKFALFSFFYLLSFVPFIAFARSRLHSIDEDTQNVDFELDLQQYEVSIAERRAEKILRIHQAQLRRYYDLNLSQNVWLFAVGVLCILLGTAVIAVTFYWVTNMTAGVQEKIIVASLGGVGAVLTNFIAVIYLKMHSTASESLNVFHTKLVESQELLLSNLLASRIDDNQKRWDTLSAISRSIVQRNKKPD